MILPALLALGISLIIYLGFIADNSKHSIKFFNIGGKILDESKKGTANRSKSLTNQNPDGLTITEESSFLENRAISKY